VFQHILIPLDGSRLAECALPHGLAMALAVNAHLTLVEVVEQAQIGGRTRAIDPMEWEFSKAEAESYLERVADRLTSVGVLPGRALLEGPPAVRVIDYADANGVDLVVLSSHGRSGLSGWNVSGVGLKVLLRAHRSILLVPAYRPADADLLGLRYRRVLVPLDGSERAELVIPVVSALATRHQCEVVLAHVVRRPELPRRATASKEDHALAEVIAERNSAEAARYLAEVQARLTLPATTRLLTSDHVANALEELAAQEDVDLVALTAHGHSGGVARPYGSLAVHFIAYGNTPLLVVQDLPRHEIGPTAAEAAIREHGHADAAPGASSR
jgi:nucleotide-binding universal stress UspA family protein